MAHPISAEDVRTALQPMLGSALLQQTPLCGHAAAVLRDYDPWHTPIDDLFAEVKDVIFGELHRALGPGMMLRLESGVLLRLRLRDIDTLADEALGVLLDALPTPAVTLEGLREYAMRSGLLSPMRVMLQRFHAAMLPMEKEMWARVIRENHPADRYAPWLDAIPQ